MGFEVFTHRGVFLSLTKGVIFGVSIDIFADKLFPSHQSSIFLSKIIFMQHNSQKSIFAYSAYDVHVLSLYHLHSPFTCHVSDKLNHESVGCHLFWVADMMKKLQFTALFPSLQLSSYSLPPSLLFDNAIIIAITMTLHLHARQRGKNNDFISSLFIWIMMDNKQLDCCSTRGD